MKLTKDQARAIFDLIRKDVEAINKKKIVLIKNENKILKAQTVEQFKKTPEYDAIQLLSKTYPGSDLRKQYGSKNGIEMLAFWKFDIKMKYENISMFDEYKTIQLLSISCKNIEQLKEAVRKHYNIKRKEL